MVGFTSEEATKYRIRVVIGNSLQLKSTLRSLRGMKEDRKG